MEYFIWKSAAKDGFCVIKPPNLKKKWEINKGIPRLDGFPEDLTCKMSPNFPNDIALADNIYGAGWAVISQKLKEFLADKVANDPVEYLPLTILNHKNRIASTEYFILHPVRICDCIDIDKSGVEWNEIDDEKISACQGLVLKDAAIPSESLLFRPKYWGANILVREDLVNELDSADFVGLSFRPAAGYKGLP